MTTYQIIADSARTFGRRNKATGQIDHGSFASRKMVVSFFERHFSWRTSPDQLGEFKLEVAA